VLAERGAGIGHEPGGGAGAIRLRAACDQVAAGGCVVFLQLFLPVFYCASGIAKAAGGDWMHTPSLLWTHLQRLVRQTWVSWLLANYLPTPRCGACSSSAPCWCSSASRPLWFALPCTRPLRVRSALGMHLMIGLMFRAGDLVLPLLMTLPGRRILRTDAVAGPRAPAGRRGRGRRDSRGRGGLR